MNPKDRIIKIAEEEFPGSKVIFDDDAGSLIRFEIVMPTGLPDRSMRTVFKAFPGWPLD